MAEHARRYLYAVPLGALLTTTAALIWLGLNGTWHLLDHYGASPRLAATTPRREN